MFAALEWLARTYLGKAGDTGGSATAGTITAKLNALIGNVNTVNSNVSNVNSNIGATNNTGGSTTSGTVMAKLNAILNGSSIFPYPKTHLYRNSAANGWSANFQNHEATLSARGLLLAIWIDDLMGGDNPTSAYPLEFSGNLYINSSGSNLNFALPLFMAGTSTTINSIWINRIIITPVGFDAACVTRNFAGWSTSQNPAFIPSWGFVPMFIPFDSNVRVNYNYRVSSSGSSSAKPRLNFLYAAI